MEVMERAARTGPRLEIAGMDTGKVKELLGIGVGIETVAEVMGEDAAAISALLAEDSFRKEVIALRVGNMLAATSRDSKMDEIEDELLDKLKESLAYIHKPREVLAAFRTVNSAQRRAEKSGGTAAPVNQTIVQLNLPVPVRMNFVTNGRGEVVEVEGQTLVTMPAQQVLNNLAARKRVAIPNAAGESLAQEYEQLSRRLPTAESLRS